MDSPDLQALIARALSDGEGNGVADIRAREQAKSAAIDELLRIAGKVLTELAAPFEGERWPDRSVNCLKDVVLEKFWRNLPSFRGTTERELRCWLETALRNSRQSFHRYARARRPPNGSVQSLHSQTDCHDPRGVLPSSREPVADEISVSRRLQLEMALGRLKPVDRRIIELRFFSRLSIIETAACVDLDERTVRRRIPRILAALRDEVEPPK